MSRHSLRKQNRWVKRQIHCIRCVLFPFCLFACLFQTSFSLIQTRIINVWRNEHRLSCNVCIVAIDRTVRPVVCWKRRVIRTV